MSRARLAALATALVSSCAPPPDPGEVDLALQKLPPQNIEAEQAVLGAILLDNSVLPPVVEILQPEDFYRAGHRRIYEAMLDLFERDDTIDLITAREGRDAKDYTKANEDSWHEQTGTTCAETSG